MKPSLAELQQWMRWIITEPEGAEGTLADPSESYVPEPRPSCLQLISDTPRFLRAERLDVYAEGYYVRIFNSLEEDYLAVARWMGDDEFRSLVSDFLLEHPSRSPELLEVGRKLPAYLASWLEKGEGPFLPELARLEWARTFAYYAPNARPGAALSDPDPEKMARLRLEAAPATSAMASAWKILEFRGELRSPDWKADQRPAAPEKRSQWLVVFRESLTPKIEEVSEPEFRLIEWAQQGLTVGGVCERFLELPEVTAEQLYQWLSKWVSRGALLCRVD